MLVANIQQLTVKLTPAGEDNAGNRKTSYCGERFDALLHRQRAKIEDLGIAKHLYAVIREKADIPSQRQPWAVQAFVCDKIRKPFPAGKKGKSKTIPGGIVQMLHGDRFALDRLCVPPAGTGFCCHYLMGFKKMFSTNRTSRSRHECRKNLGANYEGNADSFTASYPRDFLSSGCD